MRIAVQLSETRYCTGPPPNIPFPNLGIGDHVVNQKAGSKVIFSLHNHGVQKPCGCIPQLLVSKTPPSTIERPETEHDSVTVQLEWIDPRLKEAVAMCLNMGNSEIQGLKDDFIHCKLGEFVFPHIDDELCCGAGHRVNYYCTTQLDGLGDIEPTIQGRGLQ